MIGRDGAKKITLVVETTHIDIFEFWEDKDSKIQRLRPPLDRATHYQRNMGTSYKWIEDGVPQIISDLNFKNAFEET